VNVLSQKIGNRERKKSRTENNKNIQINFFIQILFSPLRLRFKYFPLIGGWEFFSSPPRPDLEPTQPPIPWIPGALFMGVKWPGLEADNSSPFSAEVRECVEI
jgi:hypothetical protein